MVFCLSAWTIGRASPDAFYYFDESPDPRVALDSSGNGFHMPYMGESSQTTADAKFGTGSMVLGPGPLMGFGSGLAMEPYAALGEEVSQMTITLWMKTKSEDALGQGVFILQRLNGANGSGRMTLNYNAARRFGFYTDASGESGKNVMVNTGPTPKWPENEWVHVAMTFDKGEVTFYFNGQALESQILPDGVTAITSTDTSRLAVFRAMVSSPGIEYVDDFGYFGDRALSADAIEAIYDKGLEAYVASRPKDQMGAAPGSARKN